MKLSDKVYDTLKWIAGYLLPSLATLWLALGKVWNLPYTTEIGATISALDVFLYGVLGMSKKNYQGDGNLIVDTSDPEKDVYNLEVNGDLSDLASKKSVTFMVNGKNS